MYNPFVGDSDFALYYSWSQHIAAGYQGGVDYATGATSGKPVRSAVNGTVVGWQLDSAGNSLFSVDAGAGVVSVYMHLKSVVVNIGTKVIEGQVIGASGGASGDYGRGQATGPHVHWHLYVSGVRSDPIAYLAANPGGVAATPEEDIEMKLVVIRNADTGATYLAGPGIWWGIPSPAYQNLIATRGIAWNDANSDLWKGVPTSEVQLWKSIYAPNVP